MPQIKNTPAKINNAPMIAVKYRIILVGDFSAKVSSQVVLAYMHHIQ